MQAASVSKTQLLSFRFRGARTDFSGGFALSTSAITSLNGRGICGIGLEFVILFAGSILLVVTVRLQLFFQYVLPKIILFTL